MAEAGIVGDYAADHILVWALAPTTTIGGALGGLERGGRQYWNVAAGSNGSSVGLGERSSR